MTYCEECGTKLADGAKFCPNCGHKVASVAPQAKAMPPEASPEGEPPSTGSETKDRPLAERVEPVMQAVEELVGTVMRDVDAPSVIGESTLCTWKNAGAGSVSERAASAAAEQVGQQLTGETARFVARRTAERSSSEGRGQAAKKSKLPSLMIGAGVLILVAVLALGVVPRLLPRPMEPDSHDVLPSDSSGSTPTSSTTSISSSEGSSGSTGSSSDGNENASSSTSSSPTGSSSSSSSESPPSTDGSSSSSPGSPTSESPSSDGSESSPSTDSPSSTESASSSSDPSSSGGLTVSAGPYSTDERPKIGEFKWLDGEAMKGNAPADARRIVDFGALRGGWKCYIVGDMEWLANAAIDAGQSGAIIAIDWYYLRDASGDAYEDTTSTSTFTGSFDGGMLDATGSGRVTIAAFWEKDGHQYATGSYIWPSGEIATIALVRP